MKQVNFKETNQFNDGKFNNNHDNSVIAIKLKVTEENMWD